MWHQPLGLWGAPWALPYTLGVRLRAAAYDHGICRPQRAPLPVISVGGLEAGGTGKTPMVAHLCGALLALGARPGLLTRGYRRHARGPALRAFGTRADVALLGDEAAMLVQGGLDIAVAAQANRYAGARALAALGADCAVMDDGFSHRALTRDLDIVMLRGEADVARLHMLPWGPLRELPQGLDRAHIVVVHHRRGPAPRTLPAALVAWLQKYAGTAQVVQSDQAELTVRDGAGTVICPLGARVVAAAGTARPHEVADNLGTLGAQVAAFRPFADHHPYTAADAQALTALVHTHGAQALVVTAKDACKLRRLVPVPLWTLHAPLRLIDPHQHVAQALARVLEQRRKK
jgi:tetraacyldisaccharide 4'-kinase